MLLRKSFVLSLMLVIALCEGLPANAPHTVQAAPLASLIGSDDFGYTADLIDGIPLSLNVCDDISSQKVDFTGNPEIFAGPFPIGFSFPYYENSYSDIYISLNGLLSTTQTDLNTVDHLPTPSDLLPNNIIAPFWMDLTFSETDPTGKVCYVNGTDTSSGREYLAVEWDQVKPSDINEPFTFQTILFDDGDILFQYLTLPTDTINATVGIEDSEGIFGLHLFHNESGLAGNSNISISYPTSHAGGRFVPSYKSGFLINQEVDLPIYLQNIGGTTITYDLAAGDLPAASCSWNVPTGWSVAFYDQNQTLLKSTDGNNCPEIQITAGNSAEISAHIRAPQGLTVGDYLRLYLSAIPKISNSLPVHMTLQAAVPASFAQAYVQNVQEDQFIPMQLSLIWDKNRTDFIAGNIYSGKNLALTQTGADGYFYAWERYYDCSGKRCSYLLGTLFNGNGNLIANLDITPYTNNVLDQELSISSTPNGNIAVTWVRNATQLLVKIYSSTGAPIGEIKTIANTSNVSAPRISAGQNNRFYVTWMQQSDIYYTVLDSNGNRVNPQNKRLTTSSSSTSYFAPAITALQNGSALIAYALDTGAGTLQPIGYQVISSDGTILQAEQEIAYPDDPHVRGIDITQLSGGNILMVWTDEGTHHVQYALLTNNGGWNAGNVSELSPDYQVGAIHASVTSDYLGHGIITWAEESQENRTMNYALVDGSGNLTTPPMVFMSGIGMDSNAAGQGNAPYDGRLLLFVPLVQR